MRLVHVVPAVSLEASGPSYTVTRLCKILVERGNQIILASLNFAPLSDAPAFFRVFGIGSGPRRLGRSRDLLKWLRRRCETEGIDVLHNHGMWQMNAVYPAWISAEYGVKLIYSPRGAFSKWAMAHGSMMKKPFWFLLQRPALEQANCFHATSIEEYEDIRRLGFSQPVAIIPNGIDLPDLKVANKRYGNRVLLFLGRIHAVKGLELLLSAWGILQECFPDWDLVIAGDDKDYFGRSGYLQKLKDESRRRGLERVKFLGPVYGETKKEVFEEADLFVLPSFSENFAVTVAESLAMATPAVVSKRAPWSGLEEQGAGWWFDAEIDPLVDCLRNAMSRSDEELSMMGKRGRRWMEGEFSWESVGARMCRTYEWLSDPSQAAPEWIRID